MKKNLLIIDDETLLLENLSILLKSYATQIYTADSPLRGLEILRQEEIHCVVCDIAMPELTGVELIRIIREEGNEVPFIFYTAFGNHELMREAAKYGAFDFLTKPIFEDLEAVVSRGLAEGFRRTQDSDEGARESEYQSILNEFLNTTDDKI
jgi:DNA-binding NtrC family response regulator